MNQKTLGLGLVVVGAIVVIISLVADYTTMGNKAGFGLYQGAGTLAGVIIAAVGVWLGTRREELPATPTLVQTRALQKNPQARSTVGKRRPRQTPPRQKARSAKSTASKKRRRK